MSVDILCGLFLVAFCAGIVDAIAGGGGLATLPALIVVGINPAQAIATNKILALASVASSAYRFSKAGVIDFNRIWRFAFASVCGAAVGAYAVHFVRTDLLAKIVPFALIAISLFFLFSRKLTHRGGANRPLLQDQVFAIFAAFPIGFYDGFFGPGTGSLYAAGFVGLLGIDLMSATANTKILNASGSLIAALIFLPSGLIVWPVAIVMSIGGILGAQLGVKIALRFGPSLIRTLLVMVSLALAIRILVQQFQ